MIFTCEKKRDMCAIKLPQSIRVGNLTVTQTEKCHLSIQKDGHLVFHAQADHPMKLAELINVDDM